MVARACWGEVASRMESARDVLNIQTVSLGDKLLAGEVFALTMVLVGHWEGPGHQRVHHQATERRGVHRRVVDWRRGEKVDRVKLKLKS